MDSTGCINTFICMHALKTHFVTYIYVTIILKEQKALELRKWSRNMGGVGGEDKKE